MVPSFANLSLCGQVMAFVSSLKVFYEIHVLYQVFIMLYTENFSMRHYVWFLQIGSRIS